MNKKLIQAQDVFLDKVNRICGRFGLNDIMAQIYSILYLNNKCMSLDDMVERLKISKGSASVNIRALERYGVVRKVWVKGSRRDHYEAETDIARVVMDRVRSMAESRLTEVSDMVSSSVEALNSVSSSDQEEKDAIAVFKERLATLKDFQNKTQSLFNMLNSGILKNILTSKSKKNAKKKALLVG